MDSTQKGTGIGIVEAREIAGRGNVMILPEACCSLDVSRVFWDIGAVFLLVDLHSSRYQAGVQSMIV